MTLAPFVEDIISRNGLIDGNYAEAYCGGAGIAVELLAREIVRTVHLNDADPRIYSFWFSVLFETDNFLRLLWDTPLKLSKWRRQRVIMNRPDSSDALSLGFATFYLNRCNRSGILSAGPIGGYKQNGKWTIDARFSKSELANRIQFIANYSNRIKIYNLDALEFLAGLESSSEIRNKVLVYLDPPYFSMGDRLYLNYYKREDHEELADYMRSYYLKWILSYDDVPEIRKLYRGLPIKRASLTYHANVRKKGRELMIFSPELYFSTRPDVE